MTLLRSIAACPVVCLCGCAAPTTVREPSGKVTVKSGSIVATTVTVQAGGEVTVVTRPVNPLEAAVGGIVGGLTKTLVTRPNHE